MRICFTGPAIVNGLHFERTHLIALAEEKGHHVDKSVRHNTNFLVVGGTDLYEPKITSKLKKAITLGVPRISVEAFLEDMDFI